MAYPTLPRLPRKLPSSTATFVNGDPPKSLLRDPGDGLGPMLIPCSYGMQAMHIHAREHGFIIETTGRGRSLARQTTQFLERMLPAYDPAKTKSTDSRVCVLDQRTIHPQLVPGHRWYLKFGMAASASPGTSNHGWYAADDMSEENDADTATDPVSVALIEFLVPIADDFGWTWELQSEPWHVSWIAGDDIPTRARAVLRAAGIALPGEVLPLPDPPPPDPPEEDEMKTVSWRIADHWRLVHGDQQKVHLPPGETGRTAAVNLTVSDTVSGGFLRAWGDGPEPSGSNVNWVTPGDTRANLAIVDLAVDDAGTYFNVYSLAPCQLTVDVQAVWP